MSNLFRKIFFCRYAPNDNSKFVCRLYCKENKENSRQKFRTYILTRYVNLVRSYEDILDKNFPSAARVYKLFSLGIKDFKDDVLTLFKVYKKINNEGLFTLSRKELEIYHNMPRDMIKVAPVLVIGSGVPFGAAIFAVAYMFPKKMLSYHFWSVEQRKEFALIDHRKKVQYYKPILCALSSRSLAIRSEYHQEHFNLILEYMGKGMHPSVEDILKCKPIFESYPFNIDNLGGSHVSTLLKLHNLHRGWKRKRRLHEYASLMHAMDRSVINEGGVEALSDEELRWASFFRGLNPVNMNNSEVVEWLKNWLYISKELDRRSYSLLLHCPVLLAYNHRTNVNLLKRSRMRFSFTT